MTDIRERHEKIMEEAEPDFEDLKWYAAGAQVRESLLGKQVPRYSFVVTEETDESMKERGFTHLKDRFYADGMGHVYELADENESLEAFLRRKKLFTVDAVAMTPGRQNYHFPLINSFDEGEDRPKEPVNPIEDLDESVIRHTTSEAVEKCGDFKQRLEEIKEELPDGFTVAEETQDLVQ